MSLPTPDQVTAVTGSRPAFPPIVETVAVSAGDLTSFPSGSYFLAGAANTFSQLVGSIGQIIGPSRNLVFRLPSSNEVVWSRSGGNFLKWNNTAWSSFTPMPERALDDMGVRIFDPSGQMRAVASVASGLLVTLRQDARQLLRTVYDPFNCPTNIIPGLASSLGIQVDTSIPLDSQRATVAAIARVAGMPGRPETLTAAIRAAGYTGNVLSVWHPLKIASAVFKTAGQPIDSVTVDTPSSVDIRGFDGKTYTAGPSDSVDLTGAFGAVLFRGPGKAGSHLRMRYTPPETGIPTWLQFTFISGSPAVTADGPLWDVSVPVGPNTESGTISSFGVITSAAHGLTLNCPVTGVSFTGFDPLATYYVISPTTNTFKLSATIGGSVVLPDSITPGQWTVADGRYTLANFITQLTALGTAASWTPPTVTSYPSDGSDLASRYLPLTIEDPLLLHAPGGQLMAFLANASGPVTLTDAEADGLRLRLSPFYPITDTLVFAGFVPG